MSSAIGKAMRLYVEAREKQDRELTELSAEARRLSDIAKQTEYGSPERKASLDYWYVIQSRRIGLGTSVGIRRKALLDLIYEELKTDGKRRDG